jgi:hypothetical protein
MIVDQKVNKQYVGVYLIDRTIEGPQFPTITKPNGFKKLMTNLIIGWKWITIPKLKELEAAKKKENAKLKEAKKVKEEEAATKPKKSN